MTVLPVSEVFGPTIQGEGPHAGRRCFFVRTGECNLHCSWCDTPFTWDRTRYDVDAECPPMTIDAIHAQLAALGATQDSVIVLSGGEPLIHHHRLPDLVGRRPDGGWSTSHPYIWHVESNGTIPPPDWWADAIAHTTLSPKVAQDDDPERRRIKPRALEAWAELADRTGAVAFKFVVRRAQGAINPHQPDLDAVDELVDGLGIHPRHVWLMPEGITPEKILHGQAALAPAVLARGYNLTTRLHTLLWHDERGH